MAAAAPAWATIYINDTGGGGCASIGRWSDAARTCSITRDIEEASPGDGIRIESDDVILDGNGHSLKGLGNSGTGVILAGVNGVTVRNLAVSGYEKGIVVSNIFPPGGGHSIIGNTLSWNDYGAVIFSSHNNDLTGNTVYSNQQTGISLENSSYDVDIRNNLITNNFRGISMESSDDNLVTGNSISSNTNGMELSQSGNNLIYANNFLGNALNVSDSGTSNSYQFSSWLFTGGNYWDNYDEPGEGCDNGAGFDSFCDQPKNLSGPAGSDAYPYTLRNGWNRHDFTWYDNIGGRNWVLMANRAGPYEDLWVDLFIGDNESRSLPLPALPGYAPGQVPAGKSITPIYDDLMGGPVRVYSRSPFSVPIVSQRILWPVGGSSLEEVSGTPASSMTCCYYWPWYDMKSPGYKNWVLVSNPNEFEVVIDVWIAAKHWAYGIGPGGQINLTFPGEMGGPVKVEASEPISGDPARVMASQRVLSNSDTAFNELPGIPYDEIGSRYLWTWYDNVGGTNWILIANPAGDSHTNIYYTVKIGNAVSETDDCNGPLADNQSVTPIYPGIAGGPVEVTTWSDPSCTTPANSIASQRVVWGPSFGETPGMRYSALTSTNVWTWYDMQSPGAKNWVLVANPADAVPDIYYQIYVAGSEVASGGPIAPGANDAPTIPGLMGGPVEVKTFSDPGMTQAVDAIVSQRVLWNGYFNEVWGQ